MSGQKALLCLDLLAFVPSQVKHMVTGITDVRTTAGGNGIGLNHTVIAVFLFPLTWSFLPQAGREPDWITPSDRQLCAPVGRSTDFHSSTRH